MKMTHMITMSINVHLMMLITVMIVHLEPIIHLMMVLIMKVMSSVTMVMTMMIMMAAVTM